MAEMNTVDIARRWAGALAADSALRNWAREHFARPCAVRLGADMRQLPEEGDAPFLFVFPDSGSSGPQRAVNSHELGLVLGIADGEWIEADGVSAMRGLTRLAEALPFLEKAMRLALPGARVREMRVDYEQGLFPLLLALVTVKVEESLPVGR